MNELVLHGETFRVPRLALVTNCQTFLQNVGLLAAPYEVRSRVSVDHFRLFLDAVGGANIEVTAANVSSLSLLCAEFGFAALSDIISRFRASHTSIDEDARLAVGTLRELSARHDEEIECLHSELALREDDARNLSAIVAGLQQQLEALKIADADRAAELQRHHAEITRLTEENRRLAESKSKLADRLSAIEKANNLLMKAVAVQQEVLRQLRDRPPSPDRAPPLPEAREVVPSDSDPLDGIIAHLTRECGGNVHDHKVVEVTSSGQLNPGRSCEAKNAADLKANSYFWSAGEYDTKKRGKVIPHARNNWLCYDFKDRRVVLTHYAIRSYHAGDVNSYNLKSWLVETSLDGNGWTEVDHHENNSDLNAKYVTRVFAVSRNETCRYVRLVNIGANHQSGGSDQLIISGFEVFGRLIT